MAIVLGASLVSSVRRLDQADAKRVWEFVHKLMDNPAHPSLSLERITQALDRRFWSGRISQGLRAVIHRDGNVNTILYAGRHDDAYQWARTHQLERNAATGELQIVASPEVVKDVVPHVPPRTPGIFAAHDDAYLLSLGLPPDWLPVMRKIVTEDQLLEVIGNLPDDAAERLFDVAAGKLVAPPVSSNGRMRTPDSYEDAKAAMPVVPDIAHPALPADAGKPDEPVLDRPLFRQGRLSGADEASSPVQGTGSRFFLLESDEDLRRLLDAPLATWLVFLHPSQQRLATGSFRGPLKITGSAGTGKTVVALHRARHLAAQGQCVFLTSYGRTLCHNLERNLGLLCSPEERARITVATVHSRAWTILEAAGERVGLAERSVIRALIEQARQRHAYPLDVDLLVAEWDAVIQAQGITSWDAYSTASRAGCGIPLGVRERKAVWDVVEEVRAALQGKGVTIQEGAQARHVLQLRA